MKFFSKITLAFTRLRGQRGVHTPAPPPRQRTGVYSDVYSTTYDKTRFI